jgi:hypothetical protein
VHADASTARAASSVDRLVAGTSTPTPSTCPPAASAALGVGGAGSHLPGGPAPCRSLPLLPLPTRSTPRSPGEKVLAARAAGTPHLAVPGAPTTGSSAPSCAPPALAPAAALRACVRAQGVGGLDRAASTATLC